MEWIAKSSSRGSFSSRDLTPLSMSPALADGLFTTSATWEAPARKQWVESFPGAPGHRAEQNMDLGWVEEEWRMTNTLDKIPLLFLTMPHLLSIFASSRRLLDAHWPKKIEAQYHACSNPQLPLSNLGPWTLPQQCLGDHWTTR